MIEELLKRLKKIASGAFFKNVSVLMTGTAIAQGLTLAVAPVLSRIYDPEAFGIFGLFIAVSGVLSVVASAKYELAILLPEKDEDAGSILWLSVSIILVITILTLFIVLFFREGIASLLGSPKLASLLWWAPVTILFTGLYNAFNYWSTRRKGYKRLSMSRGLQATTKVGAQAGLGYATSLQGSGLLFGHVLGQAVSAGILMLQTLKDDLVLLKEGVDKQRIKKLAKKHVDFPKYNSPQVLLNSISQNVPSFLLAYFFDATVVGLYWFTYRILVAPNQFIGNSIRQVFYQQANELIHKGKSALNLFLKTTGGLVLLGIGPLIILLIFGPTLFKSIFGGEWFIAGEFAQWLSIWWFAAFINPPSIMMIPILSLQREQMFYEAILTTLRLIGIIIGGILQSAILSISLFSVVGMVANFSLVGFLIYKMKFKKRSTTK